MIKEEIKDGLDQETEEMAGLLLLKDAEKEALVRQKIVLAEKIAMYGKAGFLGDPDVLGWDVGDGLWVDETGKVQIKQSRTGAILRGLLLSLNCFTVAFNSWAAWDGIGKPGEMFFTPFFVILAAVNLWWCGQMARKMWRIRQEGSQEPSEALDRSFTLGNLQRWVKIAEGRVADAQMTVQILGNGTSERMSVVNFNKVEMV